MDNTCKKIEQMSSAEGWEPFRNKWGHWVWQSPDDKSSRNLSWPGIKPPSKTAVPVWIKDGWYWTEPPTCPKCEGPLIKALEAKDLQQKYQLKVNADTLYCSGCGLIMSPTRLAKMWRERNASERK